MESELMFEEKNEVDAAHKAVKTVFERFKYVEEGLKKINGAGDYDKRKADQIDTELINADAILRRAGKHIPYDSELMRAKEELGKYQTRLSEIRKNNKNTTSSKV